MPRASGSMSNEIKIMSITYHTPQAPTVTPLQIPTIMEHPSSRAKRQRSTPQPPKKIDVIKIRILGSCSYPHIDCSWSVSAVCQVFLAVSESAYHPVPHTQCCAVVPPSPLPDLRGLPMSQVSRVPQYGVCSQNKLPAKANSRAPWRL